MGRPPPCQCARLLYSASSGRAPALHQRPSTIKRTTRHNQAYAVLEVECRNPNCLIISSRKLLYPESCVTLKNCGHSPHTEHPKELSYKMLFSYRNMKNYRKHIKMNIKTIQDYFIDIHHLENFKSTFNPYYTKKIKDVLYKKYYLL